MKDSGSDKEDLIQVELEVGVHVIPIAISIDYFTGYYLNSCPLSLTNICTYWFDCMVGINVFLIVYKTYNHLLNYTKKMRGVQLESK